MRNYGRLFASVLRGQIEKGRREDYGVLSALVCALANLFLFASKFILGSLSGMAALVADAFNNLSDMLSQFITLFSFKVAAKPADKDHPYGHARAEYIATGALALIILLMGVELIRSAVDQWLHPRLPETDGLTFGLLALSILIKLGQFAFNKRVGTALGSDLLCATAKDSLNDVIVTGSVLASALLAHLLHVNIDAYVAALVALFILKTGVQVLVDMIDRLLGASPDPELFAGVIRLVNADPDIISSHDLRIHDYGPGQVFASMDVCMREDFRLKECHAVIDRLERQVKSELGLRLSIHVDPWSDLNDADYAVLQRIKSCVRRLHPELSLHDFQVLEEGGERLYNFDVVLPDKCREKDEVWAARLEEEINAEGELLRLRMDFDRGYQAIKKKAAPEKGS